MTESYSVVLTGKLLNGESLDDVKAKVGAAFKLNQAQLDKLFSGKPVALKRGLDKKQAVRLSTRLQQLNAHAVIKAVAAKPEPAKPSVPFTDIVSPMPDTAVTALKPVGDVAPSVAEEFKPAVVEASIVEPESEEATATEAVVEEPSATVNSQSGTAGSDSIACPRCGNEQAYATTCGHCKMDLTMHITRMERKAKAKAKAVAAR
ncbi:MAG: hypothetical protein ACJA0N_002343 [Pseudohongiellaceae bacterium]|jgi:hypothetical protein